MWGKLENLGKPGENPGETFSFLWKPWKQYLKKKLGKRKLSLATSWAASPLHQGGIPIQDIISSPPSISKVMKSWNNCKVSRCTEFFFLQTVLKMLGQWHYCRMLLESQPEKNNLWHGLHFLIDQESFPCWEFGWKGNDKWVTWLLKRFAIMDQGLK